MTLSDHLGFIVFWAAVLGSLLAGIVFFLSMTHRKYEKASEWALIAILLIYVAVTSYKFFLGAVFYIMDYSFKG